MGRYYPRSSKCVECPLCGGRYDTMQSFRDHNCKQRAIIFKERQVRDYRARQKAITHLGIEDKPLVIKPVLKDMPGCPSC